jgi:hypothetical protein
MKYLFLGLSILLLSSCASTPTTRPANLSSTYLNNVSSGAIGCPSEQIQTYNAKLNYEAVGLGAVNPNYTWMAQCNGKTYYCSGPYGYNNGVKSVSCAQAQTQ